MAIFNVKICKKSAKIFNFFFDNQKLDLIFFCKKVRFFISFSKTISFLKYFYDINFYTFSFFILYYKTFLYLTENFLSFYLFKKCLIIVYLFFHIHIIYCGLAISNDKLVGIIIIICCWRGHFVVGVVVFSTANSHLL